LEITIPNNWTPREYQLPAWKYLEAGGKLAFLLWHRRSGKDDLALNWTASAMHRRVGTYWHMLPEAAQARKAIWEAIDSHTGIRRIDQAFPKALRETTRENEMFIKLKCGSTWQVIGSDNYDSLVGSPPIGVVGSEWALANPKAWAYLRPIMAENGGWAMFITTPRGKNHAQKMHDTLKADPSAFVQRLTALDTGVFSQEMLDRELAAYVGDYGQKDGKALFESEYMCSFDAPILGAIYPKELENAKSDERIGVVPYSPSCLVSTAWDIGWGDSTAIWFYQEIAGEFRVIDYYETRGEALTHYLSVLKSKPYDYDTLWMPHDANNGQLSTGKSIAEQARNNGFKVRIAPKLSIEDGINASRQLLKRARIDANKCKAGIECLENYRWGWNDRLDEPKREPVHDWSSHGSDAWRSMAVSVKERQVKPVQIQYEQVPA
jgi:hypothetical protein